MQQFWIALTSGVDHFVRLVSVLGLSSDLYLGSVSFCFGGEDTRRRPLLVCSNHGVETSMRRCMSPFRGYDDSNLEYGSDARNTFISG